MFFKRISIIGLGLIGTSLARALKQLSENEKSPLTILGYDNNFKQKDKKEILNYGIDEFETDFKYLCMADLVILCAPVEENLKLLTKIKRFLGAKTLVVDTSSTKKMITDYAYQEGIAFIGLHPIAGKELSGYQYSDPLLFKDKPFIVCQQDHQQQAERLVQLIKKIGAKAIMMTPEEHDATFARLSHLPQLLSTLLINYCENEIELSGKGFADLTRLAGSPWNVWKDILSTNKPEILKSLKEFNQTITKLSQAIESDDFELIQNQFEMANKNYQKSQTMHST